MLNDAIARGLCEEEVVKVTMHHSLPPDVKSAATASQAK
jgi:hypothetical protein